MNYKKGILSVILWFIYALTAGTVLVGTTMVMLLPEGDSRCMACCHRACCFSAVKRTAKEQREKNKRR